MIKFMLILFLFVSIISLAQEETKPYSESDENSGLSVPIKREKSNNPSTSDYTKPVFPGGIDSLNAFIKNSIILPERTTDEEYCKIVIVTFDIDTLGRVRDVDVPRRNRLVELSKYDIEAIRVVKMLPNWQPLLTDGKPLKCSTHVQVPFIYEN